jgi:tetratricopeptide (TPR) repeat protein
MASTENADHRARCEQLLREAEAFEQAEDWDNAVSKYRQLNELDHLFQGAESKLLFAVRERECSRNYNDGVSLMAAGKYAEAAEAFRKAKARGGVYKDSAALIRTCEQKQVAAAAPASTQPQITANSRKGCLGTFSFFIS